MLPAIALVGRPNVGKSTLFNRLTRTRDALVLDEPGVTRDRRYGIGRAAGRAFIVIDTGGLGGDADGLGAGVQRQVDLALDEADAIVLVTDVRDGVGAEDQRIAERLRRAGKPLVIAVNKSEGRARDVAEAEFYELGLGAPVAIAALHGHGVEALITRTLEPFPADADTDTGPTEAEEGPRLAVIGRPNVGKSTLINRLLGAERMVTSPVPGTTRDSVLVPCERDGRRFVLIDTAGIRRRARVSETIEKFSIVQSLKAIEDAAAVIALIDAREGLTDQDMHLIGIAAERGRALAIGINKWDGLGPDARRRVEGQIDRQLDFVAYATIHRIAALHGSGIAELLDAALDACENAGRAIPTPRLNEILRDAVQAHAPPMIRGRAPRLRYAHQGGRFPPLVVVHGSQAERLPAHYRRYLENAFRTALKLRGTPVRVEFRSGDNPFAGRRNKLSDRQQRRRQRVIRHTKH